MAAAVINFVVLTAALSACNSAIFSTSRTLFVLANSGQAPKTMAKISNRSVPVGSLVFSSSVLFIIVILNYILPSSIFEIISGVATVSFIFVWIILVWCHYKYRQQNKTAKSIFPMPLYPWTNFLTIIFFVIVLGLLATSKSTLISIIFALIWFSLLFILSGKLKTTKENN